MGAKSMKSYEERAALYSYFGKDVKNTAVTAICRYEGYYTHYTLYMYMR